MLPAGSQSSGSPSFPGSPHTLVLPSQNATQYLRRRGVWPSRLGPARDALSPRGCLGLREGHTPVRTEELGAWGAQPSPTSLLGSGTEWPLPGYGASLLHQQIVSIPFLQELPRAPKKGDAKTGPRPRPLQALGGPHSEGRPERGWTAAARDQGIFPGLLFISKMVQGLSQPLPIPQRCHVNSMGPQACFPPSKLRQQRES